MSVNNTTASIFYAKTNLAITRELIGFYAAYVGLGFGAVVLNTVVVGSIIAVKKLRTQRWLMLSLSLIVSDTMLSLGYGIPSIVGLDRYLNQHIVNVYSVSVHTYTNTACMAINLCQILFTLMDHMLALCIAVERVCALGFPMWYLTNSAKLVNVMMVVSIAVSIVVTGCHFIHFDVGFAPCALNQGYPLGLLQFYYSFLSCLCAMAVFSYFILIVILLKQNRRSKTCESYADMKAQRMNQQIRITKIILPILFVYFFTTVPAYTVREVMMFHNFIPDIMLELHVLLIVQLLITFNTFLNSFLYMWLNKEIQEAIRDSLKKIAERIRSYWQFCFTCKTAQLQGQLKAEKGEFDNTDVIHF